MIHEGTSLFTIGKTVAASFSSILAMFVDLKIYIWVTIFFIVLDLYYGIGVAYKQRKEHETIFDAIDYKKILHTVSKLKDYALVMVAGFVFDKYLLVDDSLYFTKVITGIVCGAQFWSVLKNLVILKPDGPWGLLKKFLVKKGASALDLTEEDINNNITNDSTTNKSKKVRKCGKIDPSGPID